MADYDALPDEMKQLIDETPPLDEVLPKYRETVMELIKTPKYYAEYLKADFANEIEKAMIKLGLNKKTLAQKLGFSRQYVGRVLNENANFTIETMAAFAVALNMKIILMMVEKNAQPVVEEKGKRIFVTAMSLDERLWDYSSLNSNSVVDYVGHGIIPQSQNPETLVFEAI